MNCIVNLLYREAWSKAITVVFFVSVFFFSCPELSYCQPSLPPTNLGDTNFFDGIAKPGFLFEETFKFYYAGAFIDNKGNKISGEHALSYWLFSTHLAYITTYKIFGGFYGFEAIVPLLGIDVDTNMGLRENGVGFGDSVIGPLIIQWPEKRIVGKPYFQRFVLLFYLPTGRYNSEFQMNPGSHLYTVEPYYSFTLFITDRLETSWRFHYQWNLKNNDPFVGFGASDVWPGQAFHVNYALSYGIAKGLHTGISGYYLRQTTPHKID
ncbi:MAG: transporter, partial [Thermodesulfobacteriota bacterium]|nr:transporter [Thermodesulfobacteriota bacterium]